MTTEFVLRDRWLRERFERQTRPLLAALHRAARRLSAQLADAEDLVHDTSLRHFKLFRRWNCATMLHAARGCCAS